MRFGGRIKIEIDMRVELLSVQILMGAAAEKVRVRQ